MNYAESLSKVISSRYLKNNVRHSSGEGRGKPLGFAKHESEKLGYDLEDAIKWKAKNNPRKFYQGMQQARDRANAQHGNKILRFEKKWTGLHGGDFSGTLPPKPYRLPSALTEHPAVRKNTHATKPKEIYRDHLKNWSPKNNDNSNIKLDTDLSDF